MKSISTILAGLLMLTGLQAQENFWASADASRNALPEASETVSSIASYSVYTLDLFALQDALRAAPMERSGTAGQPLELVLPLPGGDFETFRVEESPVMAPALAARYPSIRSYQAYSVERPWVTARFGTSPQGFHAIISLPEGRALIETYTSQQSEYYMAYFNRAFKYPEGLKLDCGHELSGGVEDYEFLQPVTARSSVPVNTRKYTIGLASSGEFAQRNGATTKEQVLAVMNQVINTCNEVMGRDVAVRLEIAEETENAIFLDPDNDPYTDGSNVQQSYQQTTAILNEYVGLSNYDVGHSFIAFCSSGTVGIGGGDACQNNLNAPNNNFKGFGISCQFSNQSPNQYAIELVCHEVGHQLSASHTFNICPGNEDNVVPSTGYEPGSGSTIMSYSGSCGTQNIINSSDGYYHTISVQQIRTYTQQGLGSTCGESLPSTNNPPEVNLPYEDGFFIPIGTPFQLTAEGTDQDGDAVTYCWEQFDIGPTSMLGSPILDAPLFRSFPPTPSPTRVFPRLPDLVNNFFSSKEFLPTYSRNLTFRCTVRDNDTEAGGVVWSELKFRSDENAGPFLVEYPNDNSVVWTAGDYQEVTWDVANTTNNRVRCNYVNVKLSVDGGFTYPYTLLENTPNDGAAIVAVPDVETNDARIRVEAANNIFFDISNADFDIEPATEPGFIVEVSPAAIPLYCTSNEDPATFDIVTTSLLDYDGTVSLSLLGELPAGATVAFTDEQVTAGQSTTLSIGLEGFTGRDTFSLQVQAEADGQETVVRDLYFIAVSSDFTGLALQVPLDGSSDIILSTDFSWAEITAADSYDFEIATNPAFGDATIESASGLTEGAYTPDAFFDDNELYFWRVRPVNACGPGDWLEPFSFHTTSVDCASNTANDLPINLANNQNTKFSKIFVGADGIISDVNLRNVEVTFQPVNSLRISLISPAGTEVILFNRDCLNTGLIQIGFDDEAPGNITCPPDDNNPVRPDQPLSAFDGENSAGEWQLKVQVVASGFGSGGSIQNWNLEFCTALAPQPPTLITNEVLPVPPGQSNTISRNFLEAQDDVANTQQLFYTLVTPPANGQLFRPGTSEPITVGGRFSQATINTFNLAYQHDGSDTDTDSFTFVVEDNEGGYIPNQVFNIDIDENAVVGTRNQEAAQRFTIFPNPARDQLTLSFLQPVNGEVDLHMINLQGQQVRQLRFADNNGQLELSTAGLPAGVYFLSVRSENGMATKKVVIQR